MCVTLGIQVFSPKPRSAPTYFAVIEIVNRFNWFIRYTRSSIRSTYIMYKLAYETIIDKDIYEMGRHV